MKLLSTLDLVYMYIYKFHTSQPNREQIIEYTQDMCKLLKSGWTSSDIYKTIKNTNIKMPIADLMLTNKPNEKNLLDPYKFYYHNQLRITPGVEVYEKDDEIVQEDTEYYLEMRASYTISNLMQYYIKTLKVPYEDINEGRLKGGLTWFVDKYSIDVTLYIIDAYANSMHEDGEVYPINPMDIQNKLKEAKELLKAKIVETQRSGDDKFVPRKRTINFGNRS